MQYCSLQHRTSLPSPITSTTARSFCFGSVSSFSLKLVHHWSPVGHLPIWGVHLSVSYLFAFSYCSCGSQGKNTEVICHSLLQWTTSCQNSPPWPVHLGWPYMAWLIVSLNKTRLWSMWSVWPQGCGQCDQFSVIVVFILSALWWIRIRDLWKLRMDCSGWG